MTGGTGLGLGALADAVVQVNDVSVPLWLVALGVIAMCLLVLVALETGTRMRAARRAHALADGPDDTSASG
jgi:hypothetical protein